VEYKHIKRHGPIKKAIMQIISTRVSGLMDIADDAKNCISGMEKTSTVDVFPRVVA
jgi:hypothetical protein